MTELVSRFYRISTGIYRTLTEIYRTLTRTGNLARWEKKKKDGRKKERSSDGKKKEEIRIRESLMSRKSLKGCDKDQVRMSRLGKDDP